MKNFPGVMITYYLVVWDIYAFFLRLDPLNNKEPGIKMKRNFRYLIVIISLALSGIAMVSCEKPKVFEDEDLINSLYQKVFDTLSYEGSDYVLETYLYRNLMPGGPIPEKRPLISILYLTNIDNFEINKNLKPEKLYVIKGKLIYKDTPDYREDNTLPVYKESYICREGPEWETDIIVDVIIKIIDKSTNENFYLISRDQLIEKVW